MLDFPRPSPRLGKRPLRRRPLQQPDPEVRLLGNFLGPGEGLLQRHAPGFQVRTAAASCQLALQGRWAASFTSPRPSPRTRKRPLHRRRLGITVSRNSRRQLAPTVTTPGGRAGRSRRREPGSSSAVSFSEAATGFMGAEVSFAGSSGGGTLAAAVGGRGANYTVSVADERHRHRRRQRPRGDRRRHRRRRQPRLDQLPTTGSVSPGCGHLYRGLNRVNRRRHNDHRDGAARRSAQEVQEEAGRRAQEVQAESRTACRSSPR